MVSFRVKKAYSGNNSKVGTENWCAGFRMASKTNENQMGYLQHRRKKNLDKSGVSKKTGTLFGIHHRSRNDSFH
jgi:hypothetical protein